MIPVLVGLQVAMGAGVMVLALHQRRSPAMTRSMFWAGLMVGAVSVVSGLLAVLS